MRNRLTWSLVSALTLLACGSDGNDPGSGPETWPTEDLVILSPNDLKTNIGTQTLTVTIVDIEWEMTPAQQSQVTERIELRKLPANEAVPFKLSIGPEESDQTVITVQPDSPLAAGWYALSLSSLPEGFKTGWGGTDDVPRSRFAVGSSPVIRSVMLCQKDGGKMRLVVDFSEPVGVPQGVEPSGGLSVADSSGADCPVILGGQQAYADCKTASTPAKYALSFGPELSGDGGIPVGVVKEAGGEFQVDALPTPLEIDFTSLPPVPGDPECRRWSPSGGGV